MLSPSETSMWSNQPESVTDKSDDRSINDRYIRGEGRIVIETNREKLPGFVNLLKEPNYMDLRPFYQRRPRWDIPKQSRLIESFIMNIPVPPVFLYEREFNSYEVMDGQQRITAIQNFYGNNFKLKGLEMWPELNGRSYKTLPDKIKAGVDRRSISSIVLLKESTGTEEEASLLRETVFERLNTGGIKLERQEIRNALYGGPFNEMINKITCTDDFRLAWGLPPWVENEIGTNETLLKESLYSKMGDSELVLRFFALRHAENYRRGMQGFLDIYARKAIAFTLEDLDFLEDLFTKTLKLAKNIYGQKLFRTYRPVEKTWEKKPHKAFYDAVMVSLSDMLNNSKDLENRSEAIVEATRKMFIDNPSGTFTGRGNTKQDVQGRIAAFRAMLTSVLRA